MQIDLSEEGNIDEQVAAVAVADSVPETETETGADESESLVVSFGDDGEQEEQEQAAQAPDWVKEVRKKNRELTRANRELEEKIRAYSVPQKPVIGKKPTHAECDYDDDKFEAELLKWNEAKKSADEEAKKADAAAKAQADEWAAKLESYAVAKKSIKVSDYDEAELAAQETFNQTQQGILLQGADNAALLVYALGKNPKKAKELAAISDPVKFAFAVAKLETQMKTTTSKTPPPAEKKVVGSGRIGGTGDQALERLRAEAARTGDSSKVIAYKRQQRKT